GRAGQRRGPGSAGPRRPAARGARPCHRVPPAAGWPGVLGQLRGRRVRDRAASRYRRRHGRAAPAGHHRPSGAGPMNVVMISPGSPAEMAFFARGLAAAGATVIGVGDQAPAAVPQTAREALAHYVQAGSLADGDAVAAAVAELARHVHLDPVEGLWEPYLLLPPRLREQLGLPGLTTRQTSPFRDKERRNRVPAEAGRGPPGHQGTDPVAGVGPAAERLGYPLIVKPIAGAGAADTYRADSPADLDAILPMVRHVPQVI